MKRIFYGLLAICSLSCIAQDESFLCYSTSTNNFNLNTHDVWASTCNPAGINEIKKICIGAYFQNHFLLKDLSSQYISIALPFNKSVAIGSNIFRYGNSLFSKNILGVLTSIKLNANIHLGAKINFQFIHQSEEKEKYHVYPQIGITYQVNDKLDLASSLQNFLRNNGEKQILRIGLSYKFDKKVKTQIQCIFSNEKYPNIGAGIDYLLNEKIHFKLNISNTSQPLHFGVAYQLKLIRINIDFGYHQQLGFSPSSSFTL